jgi:Rod binding domain-containing protein
MRNTLPKEGLLHGREERFWQDMYDQELAKKMSSAGGIGLADMMYSQLSRNLVAASRTSADAVQGRPLVPSAAPFMGGQADPVPKAAAEPASNPPGDVRRALARYQDIYEDAGATANPQPQPAGTPSAPRTGEAEAAPVETPAEVEQALAVLRQRVTVRDASRMASSPGAPSAATSPVAQGAQFQTSGMELARLARQEAGTKLGPGAVRSAIYPRTSRREGAHAGTAGEDVQQRRNVRHTTNMAQRGRKSRSDDIIRTLNTQRAQTAQAASPASSAGAEAAAAPLAPSAPAAPSAGSAASALAPAAHQQGTQDFGTQSPGGAIPPLTASAAKG